MLIVIVGGTGAQVRHWAETPNEAIYRTRYTNCDKGWAVDLPTRVVAHGSVPPNPNHGFLISGVSPDSTDEVSLEDPRIIDVYDENSLDLGSARAYLDWELRLITNKDVLLIEETKLQGLRGIHARYRVRAGNSAQVVDSQIFPRQGVVYHLLLKTTDQYYEIDSRLFARIRSGFRLLPFPKR